MRSFRPCRSTARAMASGPLSPLPPRRHTPRRRASAHGDDQHETHGVCPRRSRLHRCGRAGLRRTLCRGRLSRRLCRAARRVRYTSALRPSLRSALRLAGGKADLLMRRSQRSSEAGRLTSSSLRRLSTCVSRARNRKRSPPSWGSLKGRLATYCGSGASAAGWAADADGSLECVARNDRHDLLRSHHLRHRGLGRPMALLRILFGIGSPASPEPPYWNVIQIVIGGVIADHLF